MKLSRRPRRNSALIYALYVNAGLLLAILVAVLSHGNGIGTGSPAYGAPQMQPIAGGAGVFLMPAQFSTNTWGCYVMDIDSQNICAYQYLPGANQLRFVASRNYREDTKLREWNTSPGLAEIARLNQLAKGGVRGAPAVPGVLQGPPPQLEPPQPPEQQKPEQQNPPQDTKETKDPKDSNGSTGANDRQ